MNADSRLLPVPVFNENNNVYEDVKITRKVNSGYFLFVFAIYLLSTLLGAALVPGKLKLDSNAFLLSVSGNDASFLCAERCFFALFYLISGFTFLRFPVSFLFSLYSGTYLGICIRLILYSTNTISSVTTACLFALQLLLDVFCSVIPLYIKPFGEKFRPRLLVLYFICFALYVLFSLIFSFLISLVLK